MLHEVLFYCHILYCVLPNMCMMYLLIHDYGIVSALSCGLNGGVSNHSKNVHFMSVVPSGNFTTQKYCDVQPYALTGQFKENFIF